MGNRSRQAAANQDDCVDWVPPAELQEQWQSLVSPPQRVDKPCKHELLARIVENDIIPRLLLSNRPELAIAPPVSDKMAAKLSERVGEFSELIVKRGITESIAYVEALRDQGASIESLFQDLLAPAARRLGELWDEDINDFMDVTIGIGHLQEIVRNFGSDFSDEIRRPLPSRRALLMTLPGEQHTFGISLLREHFLREGWRVWSGPSETSRDAVRLVKEQWYDMAGLSASAVKHPEELAATIREIRKASANPNIHILLGGYAFNINPGLAAAAGADGTATDGRQALLQVSKRFVGTG